MSDKNINLARECVAFKTIETVTTETLIFGPKAINHRLTNALTRLIISEKTFAPDDPLTIVPTLTHEETSKKFLDELRDVNKFGAQKVYDTITKVGDKFHKVNFKSLPEFPYFSLNQYIISEVMKKGQTDKISVIQEGDYVTLSYMGVNAEMRENIYNKLLSTLMVGNPKMPPDQFLPLIFAVYLRYTGLGTDRNEAYQWAISPKLMSMVSDYFGCDTEVFASPINRSLQHFGSLFLDIDKPFGSLGNYRNWLQSSTGILEANPPYIEIIMNDFWRMANLEMLKEDRPLGFVMVIPSWKDCPCYYEAAKSQYMRFMISSEQTIRKGFFAFQSHQKNKQVEMMGGKVSLILVMNNLAFKIYADSVKKFKNEFI